jgi:hypothetical protein
VHKLPICDLKYKGLIIRAKVRFVHRVETKMGGLLGCYFWDVCVCYIYL